MDVSVIIPAYNCGGELLATVSSVLRQPGLDSELIIVDDGSDAGAFPNGEELCDPRVTLAAHRGNRGVSAARNSGLARARGEYVLFADCGDRILPKCLAPFLAAVREAGADVGIGGLLLDVRDDLALMRADAPDLFPDGCLPLAVDSAVHVREDFPALAASLLENDLLHPVGGRLYRRSLLEGVRFDETVFCLLEDEMFNVDVLLKAESALTFAAPVARVAAPGADALSSRFDGDRIFNLRKLWRRYESLLSALNAGSESPLGKQCRRQMMAQYVSLLANWRREGEFADPAAMFHTARALFSDEPFFAIARDSGLEEQFVVSTLNVLLDVAIPELRRQSFVNPGHGDFVQHLATALEMVRAANPDGAERYAALARDAGGERLGVGLDPDSLWRAADD